MRNGTTIGGTITLTPLGMDGGGWVTGIDIANDGYMVTRNDTNNSAVRGPNDTTWRELFKPGTTFPNTYQIYQNPVQNTYEVCISPSNSLILYAAAMGRLWKTTDRGFNWTLLTGFKTGSLDTTMNWSGGERLGGQHMRVSPTVSNNVGFCHPVDGFYYSTDGGTTWTKNAVIPAPTTTAGGCIYFVSDTDVWVVMKGAGAYHSTTGVSGTFALVSGGPLACSSIAGGGGKVYFAGNSLEADTQLYVWNGTAFSQPTGVDSFSTTLPVIGMSVAVSAANTAKVIVTNEGGTQWVSLDTGATWSLGPPLSVATQRIAHDVPWLAWAWSGTFIAMGATVFSPTSDRLFIACGIGVFYQDAPPIAAGKYIYSITKGIRQLLPMSVKITPGGRVLISCQDRAGTTFTRANSRQQMSRHAPDNLGAIAGNGIRQGSSMDHARDDENYLAMVYTAGSGNINGSVSTDGGVTWSGFPTNPTYVNGSGTTVPFLAGMIAISNKLNMVWASTNNNGGGSFLGGVKYTTDGGTTWASPNFSGTNMTGAMWHSAFYVRRQTLVASKDTAGLFYIFCYGGGAGADDLAQRGLWKSTDGGANFTKTMSSFFMGAGVDYWANKLRLVPGNPGHLFWASGQLSNYPAGPFANGLIFSANDGATLTTLTGWSSPEDVALGAAAPGASYPAIYVLGWRSGVFGLYRCIDFNPASPTSCTWQLQEQWLLGHGEDDNVLAADPTVFGRVVVGNRGGGGAVGDNIDIAHAT